MGAEGHGKSDSGGLSNGGFRDLVAAVFVLGGQDPGIEHGQVWRNNGEEEQEDADDLWDVKHVSTLKKEGQADSATMVTQMTMRARVFAQGLSSWGSILKPPFVML